MTTTTSSALGDLDILSVYFNDSADTLGEIIVSLMAPQDQLAARTVYFIDAMDRFPLNKFREKLPPRTEPEIYDRIRVIVCLDMQELATLVQKLVQTAQRDRIASQVGSGAHQGRVIIILNGLEIMFRNSSLRSAVQAHAVLKDCMLRLRTAGNASSEFRTLVVFPADQNSQISATDQNQAKSALPRKRPKRNSAEGNPFSTYLCKYYADCIL
ncbi:LAMI_0C08548g1_1 [Lachancea mirantina]|uniref:LAMI_0C08548g1_1 n=1 Tax=Lachancea mirantina TaxID=1230905 RepID=A0A1G4J4P7_9SACH|nr:LAMI_0C08548g1_1 [Lachancea mirantina]